MFKVTGVVTSPIDAVVICGVTHQFIRSFSVISFVLATNIV
ncbi:hypothetical protein [Bartonella kosoyi]|nr:hypothetical protein [Bartonella kosoyi]